MHPECPEKIVCAADGELEGKFRAQHNIARSLCRARCAKVCSILSVGIDAVQIGPVEAVDEITPQLEPEQISFMVASRSFRQRHATY
jgi:hypothetical protein